MPDNDFYLVGVGASAGGFDALRAFFSNIHENPKVSYVVVQHLSRDYKSISDKFISRDTKVKVHMIRDHERIKANRVYIMPEDRLITLKDGHIKSIQRESQEKVNLAIDTFFHSLAENFKEKAIGIILSGSGTDGSHGILSIKEKGGMVMVQEPITAAFDSMPKAAISLDNPDYIIPPEKMGECLIQYINNPGIINEEAFNDDECSDNDILKKIIEHVSEFSNVNFKDYKTNTIVRRIEKRSKINHLDSLSGYFDHIRKHPSELHSFFNDLLIGVTNFFRDPISYKELEEKVVPNLFKEKSPYETIRVWVIASSTGEEAYSLAILLDEYIEKKQLDLDYKLFATDLNSKAIELASLGRYRKNIEANVSPERLEKHFTKKGDFYEIKKSIRKKIIFSRHNLLSDPPFIKLDLIACRNLFIYLKREVQEKLLWNFNYALKPSGYLFLGANESLESVNDLFDQVSKKHKIFKNKAPGKYRPEAIEINYQTRSHPINIRQRAISSPGQSENYAEIILNATAHPFIVVNQQNEVVYTGGAVEYYLHLPKNKMQLDIYNMIAQDLSLIFRKGIRDVSHEEEYVVFNNVSLNKGKEEHQVNISFKRIKQPVSNYDLVLIEFRDKKTQLKKPSVISSHPGEAYSKKEIEELEQELKYTKRELQLTVDELETINMEVQASNEEMLSSNEELQSTNEELQSSNEELHTVNVELKNKVVELTQLHNDINNLFVHTEIATIFLDCDLNIRKFTPAAKEHFNFIEGDIGRPMHHLAHSFQYNSFYEDAQKVLTDFEPLKKEIRNNRNEYFIMRILPYKTNEMRIEGIVITLVNITDLKQALLNLEKSTDSLRNKTIDLEKSEQDWKSLVNNTPDIVFRVDKAGRYVFINSSFEGVTEGSASEYLGKTILEKSFMDEPTLMYDLIKKIFKEGKAIDHYFTITNSAKINYYYAKLVPEVNTQVGKTKFIIITARDVTQLRKYEQELLKAQLYFKSVVNNTPDIIARLDKKLICTFMNTGASKHIGVSSMSAMGKSVSQIGLPNVMAEKLEAWAKEAFLNEKKLEKEIEYPLRYLTRCALVKIIPEKNPKNNNTESVLIIITDVTQIKAKEKEILEKKNELQSANETLDNLVHTIAHDLSSPVANMKMLSLLMEKSANNGKQSEQYIAALKSSVNRLDNKLSGLIQIIDAQFNIEKITGEISFQNIINRVKEDFEMVLKDIDADVTSDLQCERIFYVEAYLLSIIQNMVSNAIKYRQKNKILKVNISTQREDGMVVLAIKDNGIGMDVNKIKNHLFKPFKRFTEVDEGKGLGLHIIKTMVEKNGGKVEVESVPGDGAVFKVYLKEY